jgi:hypothetical protein
MESFFTFLTILVGAFVACIAYQQYRISAEKFKLDLFDRRFSVYKGTQVFLSHILKEAKFELEQLFQFRADTQDAVFLFDDDIMNYLKEIDSKALEFRGLQMTLEGVPRGEERTRLCQKETELLTWLTDQLPKLKEVFSPYLKFETWKDTRITRFFTS